MKKTERIIVYGIAVLAVMYGIWAHGTLQRIYRINRNAEKAELLASVYEKFNKPGSPFAVSLYDYEFEETSESRQIDNQEGFSKIIWHAWYFNSYTHFVHAYYYIEFRNMNGSLLAALDPIPATLVPTGESSGWLPLEQTGEYWMPNDVFRQVAYSKSRINLIEKK